VDGLAADDGRKDGLGYSARRNTGLLLVVGVILGGVVGEFVDEFILVKSPCSVFGVVITAVVVPEDPIVVNERSVITLEVSMAVGV